MRHKIDRLRCPCCGELDSVRKIRKNTYFCNNCCNEITKKKGNICIIEIDSMGNGKPTKTVKSKED